MHSGLTRARFKRVLQIQQPSRKLPKAGDVFRMHLITGQYLFGRVITTEACLWDVPRLLLLYVYNYLNDDGQVPEILRKEDLLLPPKITNRQGWLKGYFETVLQRPLGAGDSYERHCLEEVMRNGTSLYYDEYDNPLSERLEPRGLRAVDGYTSIDNDIADALGIPNEQLD